LRECPNCGFTKAEIANKGSILQSINDTLIDKLSFLDYPQLWIIILTRGVIILFTIFVIPDFIRNSEFFWLVVGIFSVYGLIKEVANIYPSFRVIYKTLKLILFVYFGAGFANLISHTGRLIFYRLSYYFNLSFIYDQLTTGNTMIILGAFGGIGVMLLINGFYNEFKVKDYESDDET
jgi:hypothetical protein